MAAAVAVLGLGATPCMAAGDLFQVGNGEHRVAAFAGANLRLSLGGTERAKPSARLQLTTIHSYEDRQSASPTRTYRAAGLELGMAGTKNPGFFMMGQDVSQLKRKLGVNGSSSTLWIIGGIALAGAAAFLLFADDGNNAQPQPAPPAN